MMRAFLATVPPGSYAAEDFLDDDGRRATSRVRIAVTDSTCRAARKRGQLVTVDFTGSSPQVAGSINAVEAITYSACFYVFRCLLREDVPATAGLMRPIRLIAPAGTRRQCSTAGSRCRRQCRNLAAHCRRSAAGAGAGAARSHSGGVIGNDEQPHHRRNRHAQRRSLPFAYYETIAGGSGASAAHDGVSGVHTHMTNSLNTPAEALEYSYPFRVTRYSLRPGSGGDGRIAEATESCGRSKC